MNCINKKQINTANVITLGAKATFDVFNKSVNIETSGYTVYDVGGQANITNITITVIDPQQNTHTATINPSLGQHDALFTNLPNGLLYFGTYHIKLVLTEADSSLHTVEYDVDVCDLKGLTPTNYIKGCVEMDANCVTAKLLISDKNNYIYNKKKPINIKHTATLYAPIDADGTLDTYTFNNLPYSKTIADYYTGTYQLAVTTEATYELDCDVFVIFLYKSNLTKTINCTSVICDMNCCISDAIEIINRGGEKGALMQERFYEALPFFNQAVGLYLCGDDATEPAKKVKSLLNCDCVCRAYKITPAPITLGNKNLFGSCGTSVTIDDNGDYLFHSFAYTFVKGEPLDNGFSLVTTQIDDCTKQTTITLDYDNLQNNILNVIANNPTYIQNWQNVLQVNKCPCDGVEMNNIPEINLVGVGQPNIFRLNNTFFTKNSIIKNVEYKDHSTITGGTLQYTQYFDNMIGVNGIVTNYPNSLVPLPCSVCGNSIANESRDLYTVLHSTCGCDKHTQCTMQTPQVQYSERYMYSYRVNFQITNPSVIVTINGIIQTTVIYFNDVVRLQIGTSDFGTIRKVVLETNINTGITTLKETRTISGKKSATPTPATYSNWGDEIEYFYPSGVCLDPLEMTHGEPAIYFVTYGGLICRMIKERETECDERGNWKTHIIGGINGVLSGFGVFPLAVGQIAPANSYIQGVNFYGIKKFIIDENGNQAFVITENTSFRVYILYYTNFGDINDGANWRIFNPDIQLVGSSANINVEDAGITSEGIQNFIIWHFGLNNIKRTDYLGNNTIASITNLANYATTDVCVNPSVDAVTYLDGLGTLATISEVTSLSKVGDRYYFCNRYTLAPNSANYLRYFQINNNVIHAPASYTFSTEIVPNAQTYLGKGTYVSGVSSNVSGATEGIVPIPNVGNVSLFKGGIRIFDFTNNEVKILSGQQVAGGNLVEDNIMDTQFEYKITC